MMTFLELLVYFIFGVIVATVIEAIIIVRSRKLDQKEIAESPIKSVEVEIEKYNDDYLVFDKKTKLFLAQGKDYLSLHEILTKKFPNTAILVGTSNLENVGLKIGKFEC